MTGENRDEVRRLQARALGEPMRRAVHRFVVDAGRPVGVSEIAAHVPLSANTVRLHLSTLRAAGLLREDVASARGRGRPPLQYTAVAGTLDGPNPYERLSLLLLDLHRSHSSAVDVGRAAALVQPPARLADNADPVRQLAAVFDAAGFDPRVIEQRQGRADIVLRHCPFTTAAAADAQIVCELHRGLAAGAAASIGGIDMFGLTPEDPHRAGCRVHVRRIP